MFEPLAKLQVARFTRSVGGSIEVRGDRKGNEGLTEVASIGLLAKPIGSPLILRHVENKVMRSDCAKF